MAGPTPDYYRILGVSRTASNVELKKAYHRLARRHHPDISRDAEAETIFKQINEAYEVLSDQARRAQYDYLTGGWRQRGRSAYVDQTILDEFIASHFDAKGDIQRERACLFYCPHCGGETTVFFDYTILSWQNLIKRCDVCSQSIAIDYEVKKGRVVLFEVKVCL